MDGVLYRATDRSVFLSDQDLFSTQQSLDVTAMPPEQHRGHKRGGYNQFGYRAGNKPDIDRGQQGCNQRRQGGNAESNLG